MKHLHAVHVVKFEDRARAECRCGDLDFPERRGDRARHLAELDAKAHLEKVESSREWTETEYGFAIEASSHIDAPCPVCDYVEVNATVGLLPNSFGEVVCSQGHVFESSTDDDYVFLELQSLGTEERQQVVSSEHPIAIFDMNTDAPTCPFCKTALLFGPVDVLKSGSGPYVVGCVTGHEFDVYVTDFMTVHLFPHSYFPPF